MAPSLPDLPAELLLEIVKSFPSYLHRHAMELLRATHPQINEKIVHAYAFKYHRTVTLYPDRTKVTRLQSIAAGYLGGNIESLSIDLMNFVRVETRKTDSDSTDAEVVDWRVQRYGEDKMKYNFDDDLFTFVTDGSCTTLLEKTFPEMHNMSSLTIHSGRCFREFNEKQIEELKARWRLLLRIILSAVFNHCRPLQTLRIERYCPTVTMSIPILDLAGISADRLSSIKELAFDLDVGSDHRRL